MPTGHAGSFPNPFFDLASTFFPSDIKKTFGWCEYIYVTNGVVRSAIERIAQYFITEIASSSEDTEHTEKLAKWLKKNKLFFLQVSIDALIYGNTFNVIYYPFKRMLHCKKCNNSIAATDNYTFTNFKFFSKCQCGYEGEFDVNDQFNKNIDDINFLRLDPKTIKINFDIFSGKSEYYWDIPKSVKEQITNNTTPNYLVINSIPYNILESIRDNKTFKFDKKAIFHFKRPSISGVSQQWGFPILLSILKLNYYNAILRRANEAISLDFIVPFRVLSPGQSNSGDPFSMMSSEIFVTQMQEMIYQHRLDNAAFKISPIPLNYQAFGAEKKALDVSPEVKMNLDEMLDSLNFPAELYRNNLQYQAMPGALRLFENTWEFLIMGVNELLQWVVDSTCNFMNWDKEDYSFTRVSIADDMEKKQILMQLGSGQQISMATALKPFGIDFLEEQKKLAYQNKAMSEIQKDMQRDMMAEQKIAGPDGAPQGMGPVDPTSIISQAQEIAMNMLQMPYESRRKYLHDIKTQNPTLHAVVMQKMKELRQQSRTEQGAENMAQAGMGGAQQVGDPNAPGPQEMQGPQGPPQGGQPM